MIPLFAVISQVLMVKLAVFGGVAAMIWIALEYFGGNNNERTEERLEEFSNPTGSVRGDKERAKTKRSDGQADREGKPCPGSTFAAKDRRRSRRTEATAHARRFSFRKCSEWLP